MTNMEHIIWSNDYLDYADWQEYLEEEFPDLSEDERIAKMHEQNWEHLDDERVNLNIKMPRPIIVIGDLGRWNGRVFGYKELSDGKINDCLHDDCDYLTWYLDSRGDFRCKAIHHDGTNHYLYRSYREGVSEKQIENFQNKILHGTVTRTDINRVTQRLGDKIAAVYGWDIPSEDRQQKLEQAR